MLEAKGDFCNDIRRILTEAKRGRESPSNVKACTV